MMVLLFAACLAAQLKGSPQLKVVNIVVTSTHFEKSVRFYKEKIGWRPFFTDKTSTFFRAGGVNVVIIRAKPGVKPSRICLDLAVSDLAETAQQLKKKGVKLESSSKQMVTFYDPDHNLVEVVHG